MADLSALNFVSVNRYKLYHAGLLLPAILAVMASAQPSIDVCIEISLYPWLWCMNTMGSVNTGWQLFKMPVPS